MAGPDDQAGKAPAQAGKTKATAKAEPPAAQQAPVTTTEAVPEAAGKAAEVAQAAAEAGPQAPTPDAVKDRTARTAQPTEDEIAAALAVLKRAPIGVLQDAGLLPDAEDDDRIPTDDYATPDDFKDRPGLDTLMDACDIYGIDPDPNKKPRELLNWAWHPKSEANNFQAYIQLVTAGGVKLRHYEDQQIDEVRDPDTARQIRDRLRLWQFDKATGTQQPLPLPADLTLPEEAVTGLPVSTEHSYPGGYLRSGGKVEAAKREAVRAARSQATVGGAMQPLRRRRR